LKLFEYEAKNILRKNGIPTPKGETATSPSQIREATAKLASPYVLKAQVLVAGRGKAGGIVFANSAEQAEKAAEKLFTMQIKGFPVKKLLVEEKTPIKKELYFAVAVDRTERSYVAVASAAGGVDIEELAQKAPQTILKTSIDARRGFGSSDASRSARAMGYNGKQQSELALILKALYQIGMKYDAELIELNPLAETADGSFVALDARLIVDDNALFRHPELEKLQFEENREHTPREIEAMKNGLAYVELEGEVGIIGNGAGLVMATLDLIEQFNGKPADFLDLGGGASTERITKALSLVLSAPKVKAVFVNILGGMTRCDDVARAILQATQDSKTSKPVIVRLVGTNEQEGRQILTKAGMPVLDSMEEAAKQAVKAAEAGS
jgi:succinyl-CoA synthetase beta subunit